MLLWMIGALIRIFLITLISGMVLFVQSDEKYTFEIEIIECCKDEFNLFY